MIRKETPSPETDRLRKQIEEERRLIDFQVRQILDAKE